MAHLLSWYWDKGQFREENEDSFSLQRVKLKRKEASFLLVCDGIGGLPEGETASGFVAEQLTQWFYQEGIRRMARLFWRRRTGESALAWLFSVQQKLEACERAEGICCGTTCTMALVKGRRFLLLHTGDSRAYVIGRRERQLTCDHHEGAALNRCVGAFGFQRPDVIRGHFKKGEQLLLCTDGFCRLAQEGFLKGCLWVQESLIQERKPELFYRRLKGTGSFLTAQGERDNMTALLLAEV